MPIINREKNQVDNSKITIDAYNKNADRYEDKFMDFKSYRDKIQEFREKYIYKYGTVLDIGCGPGNNARLLMESDNTLKITGVDLSEAMIEKANKNAPGCTFFVRDLRELDFEDKFDVVIASFCIVHLSDDETENFIKKVSKFLKKNGTLYLSFMEGKKAGLETTSFSEDQIFFNYYDRSKIRKLLSDNLILTIEIQSEDYIESDGSKTDDVFIYARKI